MPTNCPHCKGDIQNVISDRISDRLKRAEERTRSTLDAKAKEIELLEKRVAEMSTSSGRAGELESLVGDLRGQLEQRTRGDALREHGIPSDALGDIVAIYESRQAGKPEAERATFGDFLAEGGEGRSMVLLSSYFAAPADAAPAPAAPVAPVVRPTLPNANAGAASAAPKARPMSVADVRAYLSSPRYKSLPIADRRAKLAELKEQVATRTG
jgi:hypothetical protein